MVIRIETPHRLPQEHVHIVDDILHEAAKNVANECDNFSIPAVVQFIDSDGNVEEWDLTLVGEAR